MSACPTGPCSRRTAARRDSRREHLGSRPIAEGRLVSHAAVPRCYRPHLRVTRCLAAGAIIAIAMLLTACQGPSYSVQVSSLRGDDPPSGSTYFLMPADKDVTASDLQFREYATFVHKALLQQGYRRAADQDSADLIIGLAYGIGEPRTEYYTYPIMGQVGGGTTFVNATTSGPSGVHQTTGTVMSMPRSQFGATGVGSRTMFPKHIGLFAIDVKRSTATNEFVSAWQTFVTSTDINGDLRRAFPVMLAAAQEYIGTSTGQAVQLNIAEQDERVLALKGMAKQ